MVQEIEIKSLLTEQKYDELRQLLPQKYERIHRDTITTVRFRPKDIRVRYSERLRELVFKEGDPTDFSRKELSINLKDVKDCEGMIALLRLLGFTDDPSWVKHKEEFICEFEGHKYTLSLQHIERFAYILEAEILSDDDSGMHISNLKQILKSLGCEPIDSDEFRSKIDEYIKNNRR